MIGRCRERYANDQRTRFTVAHAQRLPFPSESFVAVLGLGVLEYVGNLDRAVGEMTRVLRPGGTLVFAMQNRRSPYRLLERWMGTWIEPCPQFTGSFAKRLVRRHGLVKAQLIYYDFNVLPRPLDARHPRVAVALAQRLEALHHTPLRWLGTGFLVNARRGA